jgi:hypothetical protein
MDNVNDRIKSKINTSIIHSQSFQLEILPSHLPVRALLEEAAREYPDWKKMPAHIRSIEDIFEGAKELVTSGWSKKVITYLAEKCRIWADELPHKPEYDDEAELLRNPELLEQKLKIHQFGALESLRKVLPLAWQELILMASERQLAAIVVARHWIKELSPERIQEIVQTSQVHSIKELELFIDCAAIVGKYIDQAYVRQIELTDIVDPVTIVTCKRFPGQKEFKCEFHPLRQTPQIEIKPYRTVFSLEWEHLVQALEHVARKVDYAFSLGELSESYRNFSAYVRELAQTYGSTEINHDILHERWDQLLDHMRALAEEGCPIMLVP